MPKVIGIVGSRRRDTTADYIKVRDKFLQVYAPGDTLVSGGCPKGADRFAEMIAQAYNVPITIHLPDKSKIDHKLAAKLPHAAYAIINYARNTLIAADADVLIACVAANRKGGTEDTVKKYLKMRKKELYLV